MPLHVAFDWPMAGGRCLGIWLPPEGASADASGITMLTAREQAIAASFGPVRRRTWVGGRAAMREALIREGVTPFAVLSDDRGAPVLPPGMAGSISHKDAAPGAAPRSGLPAAIAVALVAREETARVGVDVELTASRSSIDVASRVLAADELAELALASAEARAREVLLRFSAKEALYKAVDPFVRRYVAFDEVSVTPFPDGSARVELRLREGEGPFCVAVRWRELGGLFVTTARVERC